MKIRYTQDKSNVSNVFRQQKYRTPFLLKNELQVFAKNVQFFPDTSTKFLLPSVFGLLPNFEKNYSKNTFNM